MALALHDGAGTGFPPRLRGVFISGLRDSRLRDSRLKTLEREGLATVSRRSREGSSPGGVNSLAMNDLDLWSILWCLAQLTISMTRQPSRVHRSRHIPD